jgi:O-antigen ligase
LTAPTSTPPQPTAAHAPGLSPTPAALRVLTLALTLAVCAPTLLSYNVSPSPTFLNQALSVGLWALVLVVARPALPAFGAGLAPLLAGLAVVAVAVLWSWGPGALPASLALSALVLLAAAALVMCGAAGARRRFDATGLFAAWCVALLITALVNAAVAAVQVFAPDVPDGKWLAISGIPGRAVGNLRQPNHLSSVLLWGAVALVALSALRRVRLGSALAMLAVLMLAVVLTASRTGLVSVALLALWGLLDRRLPKPTRALLLAAPLLYALAWAGMSGWSSLAQHEFGGAQRLAETDISGSRFGIWANTLALIRANPWAGVGFGEFNMAWTLTPFPGRPTAFFDHTHNLPLQLAVELGLPLAALVMALLLWALGWAAWRGVAAGTGAGDEGIAQRSAVMLVLMIGLHSLLEYPLWYAYFLLPAAWSWGFALGGPRAPRAPAPGRASAVLTAGALAMALATPLSVWDYRRVVAIFYAQPDATTLEQRIAIGQRSVLFAHHADYAALTANLGSPDAGKSFERASHHLLDTRLMLAWARSLHARGETDAARFIAARLREFNRPESASFFEPCASLLPASEKPFQCSPPQRAWAWRDFLVLR